MAGVSEELLMIMKLKDEVSETLQKITGNIKGSAKSTDEAAKATGGWASVQNLLKGGFDKTAVAIAVGTVASAGLVTVFGALLKVTKEFLMTTPEAVKGFAALESRQNVLAQQLKATGYAAAQTVDSIRTLGAQLGDTEGVRAAAQQLLQYREISGNTFTRVIKDAKDIAAVSKASGGGMTDMASAAKNLALAIEDPLRSMEGFRRSNVYLSPAVRENVRQLVELGKNAQAAELILQEVEKTVGGAAKASAMGLAGAFSKINEQLGIGMESWGEWVTQVLHLTGAFKTLGNFLQERNNRAGNNGIEMQIRQEIKDLQAERQGLEEIGKSKNLLGLLKYGSPLAMYLSSQQAPDPLKDQNIQWSDERKRALAGETQEEEKINLALGSRYKIQGQVKTISEQILEKEKALASAAAEQVRLNRYNQDIKQKQDNFTLKERVALEVENMLLSDREKTLKGITNQIFATLDPSEQELRKAKEMLNATLDMLEARKAMTALISASAQAFAAEQRVGGDDKGARLTLFNQEIEAIRSAAAAADRDADAKDKNSKATTRNREEAERIIAVKIRERDANERLIEQQRIMTQQLSLSASKFNITAINAQIEGEEKLARAVQTEARAEAERIKLQNDPNRQDPNVQADYQARIDMIYAEAAANEALIRSQPVRSLDASTRSIEIQTNAVNMLGKAKMLYIAIEEARAQAEARGEEFTKEHTAAIERNIEAIWRQQHAYQSASVAVTDFFQKYREEAANTGAAVSSFLASTTAGIESSTSQAFAQGIENLITQAEGFRETFVGIFHSMVQQILQEFIRMFIIKQIMSAIFGGLTGGGGGLLGGLLGGGGGSNNMIGMINNGDGTFSDAAGPVLGFAKGGAFYHGQVVEHFAKGGIVDKRTRVPMAEMGEEGPEAVIPLARDGQGRLGVRGGGGTTNVSVAPSISIQLGNNQGGEAPSEAQARRLGATLDAAVKEKVIEVLERESRPGGILRGTR